MRPLAALVSCAFAVAAFAAEDPAVLVAKLQPATGWTASEPARTATHDTLFDLIDGGAELYQEYGFVRAVSWQFENAARSTIQIELYEMTDAPAAYGVWSLMQTGNYQRGTLGQGSLRFGYYVAFWSGPYFASVTGAQPDAATQAEVDRLASELAAQLPRNSALPDWFSLAPSAGLSSAKYFRGRIGLSNISVSDAVGLFDAPEGIIADYESGQLVVLPCPDREAGRLRCAAALDRLKERATRNRIRTSASSFTILAEGDEGTLVCFDDRAIYVFSGTDQDLRSAIRMRASAAH
ncbi:MAG TPA: DUF6599 family protein [Opitutaceae bacterium]|nr:DUF6599 family protein [Opitutaceae bacterium]